MQRSAFGVFDDPADAARAAERLAASGFEARQVRTIREGDVASGAAGLVYPLFDRSRLGVATVAGTIPAAFAGLMVGMMMHQFNAGAVFAPLQAVVGLLLGAALGAFLGAYMGLVWATGTPAEHVMDYLEAVHHGATLVVVPAPRARLAARAARVLAECGARNAVTAA